ncbi:hypothetical protein BD410DRAFT_790898 [Rickenella mellea]|uniref:Arrestin-like N-terminal domain-containing protein n=1 Tax=Rickenella mellea TaxID=50990 RepID=A0A4Y7PZI9_9AGAM|nr:hypothetical protein BD410DRAFT_790898 [Rickenella mellea]
MFSKGRKRLILTVSGRGTNGDSVPSFVEGETITGRVGLELDKAERNLTSVELSIEGQIGNLGYMMESNPTFEHRQTLWNISFGDPRAPQAAPRQPSEPQVLAGKYSWDFSFSIPHQFHAVGFKVTGDSLVQKLPPTLSEGDRHVSYTIGVKIKRNTTFEPFYELTTPFVYTPRSEPKSFSLLRISAYRENAPLNGPDLDPDGWKVFPPVQITGYDLQEFGRVDLSCTLALATPLSYTRGSVIPLMLELDSQDENALGARFISSPYFPKIKFYRTLREDNENVLSRRNNVLATWSVAGTQHRPSQCRRMLYGEIKLPAALRPSFDLGDIFIKYMVGFENGAFAIERDINLFQTEVQIVTDYAPGPRPLRYHRERTSIPAWPTG